MTAPGPGPGTGPLRGSEKRTGVISDDDRGPDSIECRPGSPYGHTLCILDFRSADTTEGFICGCECHDSECPDCGAGNGGCTDACILTTAREAA